MNCFTCCGDCAFSDDTEEQCRNRRCLHAFSVKEHTALDGTLKECFTQIEEIEAVDHPAHYQGKHECIDEMIELFGLETVIGFCKCNVYKYRYRADQKNGEEDIEKADWYMDKLIELQKG